MKTNVTLHRVGDHDVYRLETEQSRAEVWPGIGFNCLRWQVRLANGQWGDILYSAADWLENPVPTRSGHPILFPFPNRLAAGRMTFHDVNYQLPLTEATKTHAIHGFTPRVAWNVVGSGTSHENAFLMGRFRMSEQFSNAVEYWPSDAVLRLNYTLSANDLLVDAVVENGGSTPLPYGLGYHPYFRHPAAGPDETIDRLLFQCRVDLLWESEGNIPTGRILPTPAEMNFENQGPLNSTFFDTLFTGLDDARPMRSLASLRHPDQPGMVHIFADESFPHLVLFTPPHRKAIAIEPYSCATNAAHLPDSVPHGWRVLLAGQNCQHRVKYSWDVNERVKGS